MARESLLSYLHSDLLTQDLRLRRFRHLQDTVDCDVLQHLNDAGGPPDFDRVGLRVGSQAEVDWAIA